MSVTNNICASCYLEDEDDADSLYCIHTALATYIEDSGVTATCGDTDQGNAVSNCIECVQDYMDAPSRCVRCESGYFLWTDFSTFSECVLCPLAFGSDCTTCFVDYVNSEMYCTGVTNAG